MNRIYGTDGNVYETSISNGKQKMIKVPFMKMPECCDKCDFGRCCYSHPFTGSVWADDEKAGKHGYNCQLEYYEKGRYE